MADNNIALGVQVPDAMKSISGMMNFAGQAQSLQSGRQTIESNELNLQKSRQGNKERIATQEFMSNPENWQTDGRIDLGKMNTLTKIAPMTGADTIQKISTLDSAQTAAKQASQGLDQSGRAIVAGPIGVLGRMNVTDPNTYLKELDNIRTINKGNSNIEKLVDSYKTIIQNTQAGPHIPQMAVTASQSLLNPSEQQTALSPTATTANLGGTINQAIVQPAVGGNAPSVQIASEPLAKPTLAPGSLETIEADALGNKTIVSRSPQGSILSTRPMPQGQQTPNPQQAPQPQFSAAPGDLTSVPVLEGERNQARNILASAPIAHTTNQGILDELGKVTSTGQTGGFIARARSIVGAIPGATDSERAASAYDLIGKYTERNALEAAKAMGPGTNAGLEAAIKANGSAAYNPTALRKITLLNDALVSGAEAYQPGLEKAIAANPQRGVLAKREFDQAWAQNFDPRIPMLDRAIKDEDMATVDEIKKQAGPRGMNDLLRKAQNIDRLSSKGRL